MDTPSHRTDREGATTVEGEPQVQPVGSQRKTGEGRATEVAPPEPTPGKPETQETAEELVAESPQSVRELLDQWAESYKNPETPADEKGRLAYRLVQMEVGLRLAHVKAEDVKIAEAASGVLGFYQPASRELAITPAGLELPPSHYRDVLVHEAVHAGKITGRRILDEGMAQRLTERTVASPMPGIYSGEQHRAEAAFGSGAEMVDVLDKYDFDHPEKLVEPFLEETWHERWDTIAKQLADEPLAHTQRERGRLFDRMFADENGDATKLTRLLEKGAPELFEKFGGRYKVLDVQKKAFEELYEDWVEEQRAAA